MIESTNDFKGEAQSSSVESHNVLVWRYFFVRVLSSCNQMKVFPIVDVTPK